MNYALFIGRFQPFHNAHLENIKNILKENGNIAIAIGSSQKKNTFDNPFSFKERRDMITEVLKNQKIKNFSIAPIPDLYDDRKWVSYIKQKIRQFDIVYSGNSWTLKCFKKFDFEVRKIKLIKGLSSTLIRERIVRNEDWKSSVPREIFIHLKKIDGVRRIKRLALKNKIF